MELGFSEEQVMLRDTVASLCADHCDSAVIRAMEHDEQGFPDVFWQGLSEIGLAGLRIDEAHGGVGMGLLETALVYEEFGRKLAVSPHFESCLLSASLLAQAASKELCAEWLPQLASGQKRLVIAWQEVGVGADISGLGSRAERCGDEVVVTGEKVLVPYANSADAVLVLCQLDEQTAAVLVPRSELSLAVQPNHADQKLFAVTLDGIKVPVANLLGSTLLDTADFSSCWEQAMLEGQIAQAAFAIGGASRIQDMAIEYAGQRQQFGQPIGAFQSIAHYLADRATEIEGARLLVYQAAWARDQGLPYTQLAMMAKLQATSVFRRATVTGVQVHGGMGFSEEADPQLYYRRAKHLQLMYWDSRYLEQRIAEEVFA